MQPNLPSRPTGSVKKKAGPYTPLRGVCLQVLNKRVFRGNSVFSRWIWDQDPAHPIPNQTLCPTGAKPMRYVVYSYDTHFPMYVWDEATGKWYGNSDRYSPTTSRHQSACHPGQIDHWFQTDDLRMIVAQGPIGYLISKVQAGVQNTDAFPTER